MSGTRLHRLGSGDVALLRQLNALFAVAFDDAESYAGAPPTDAYLASLLAHDNVIALVAITNDAVIGGLVAYDLVKFEQARREIYIYDLAVLATHRRRGIATTLIDALCAIARERGASTVFVQADRGDTPAIALYTKLGSREDVLHFDIAP